MTNLDAQVARLLLNKGLSPFILTTPCSCPHSSLDNCRLPGYKLSTPQGSVTVPLDN